jgi:hypothetical protein
MSMKDKGTIIRHLCFTADLKKIAIGSFDGDGEATPDIRVVTNLPSNTGLRACLEDSCIMNDTMTTLTENVIKMGYWHQNAIGNIALPV